MLVAYLQLSFANKKKKKRWINASVKYINVNVTTLNNISFNL